MPERFIKYIPSEKAKWLRKHHTALYLLLSLAVEQARWSDDHNDGLLAGDSILGNFEDAGTTRQQYRDAIIKGENLGIWEVVYNRNCKKLLETPKRTIKRTIKSIVVNIKNSEVWDLNINAKNQSENQQGTNREPIENHKQEDLRRSNKIVDLTEQEESLTGLFVAKCKGSPSVISIQRDAIIAHFKKEKFASAEIEVALEKFKKRNPVLAIGNIPTLLKYIHSILENQKAEICKKKPQRKISKESLKTPKETCSENATSEPILERLMRQNGLS